jgi:hypothetical protein
VAIQPGSAAPQAPGSSRGGDTAKLRVGRGEGRRRPLLAVILALAGLAGIAVAGFGISGQLKPRQFTLAQQRSIEAWEVTSRWRTIPKTHLFPAVVDYRLSGGDLGPATPLRLRAWRLEIARQAQCAKAAGARPALRAVLGRAGCQAVLRATYADSSGSLVLTVGIAVLKDAAGAATVTRFLTGHAATGSGATSRSLVLHPLRVIGTPAAAFGMRQRQLSWVVGAGTYVVLATVGFADGRPHVPVAQDSYTNLEMTSLARGVAVQVARPLGATPAVPHCPGALSAC